MEPRKLAEAVRECLVHSFGAEMPFGKVREYIEQLKADPNWTDTEIIEVQTTVIRELLAK